MLLYSWCVHTHSNAYICTQEYKQFYYIICISSDTAIICVLFAFVMRLFGVATYYYNKSNSCVLLVSAKILRLYCNQTLLLLHSLWYYTSNCSSVCLCFSLMFLFLSNLFSIIWAQAFQCCWHICCCMPCKNLQPCVLCAYVLVRAWNYRCIHNYIHIYIQKAC